MLGSKVMTMLNGQSQIGKHNWEDTNVVNTTKNEVDHIKLWNV